MGRDCVSRIHRKAIWLATASCLGSLALGAPVVAQGQTQAAPSGGADIVGEIVVTASRRSETTTKLPFNISAYNPDQLARSNITNVAGLSSQVPNFVIQDQGARSEAQSVPIIRGLNASGNTGVAPRYFQSPVGYYQDNAPITGSLPLMDLERIEVLRGPQGTLYGAGTLSGAVRLIANAPKLGQYSGYASASVSDLSKSSDTGYDFEGAVNIPVGDTLAFRVTAKHQYEAGYVDLHDIMRRQNDDYVSGAPILQNPADVANSSAVYFDEKDANHSKTSAVRGAVRWKPNDKFDLQASYSYAKTKGQGGPVDGHGYAGGPSPIDPRITLKPTGQYERSQATLEPFDRETRLGVVDVSYDLGFATLASTIAFGKTEGQSVADQTIALLGSPYGVYYTGVPANPRAVVPISNTDRETSNTQEIRLVSNGDGPIDYVVGTYFQQQKRRIGLGVYDPGADVYSAAANGGSTVPMALGGTYVPLFANGLAYGQTTAQRFREYSLFGDLTWHVSDRWSVTGGARVFRQTFDQKLHSDGSFFFLTVDAENSSKDTSKIFKLNTSYKLNDTNQVYATFSQGFRRGGANAFPLDGPVLEPAELLTYTPDKTNNFELGLKGRLGGVRYSFDGFYVKWDKPQIDLTTPYTLTYVVVNGEEAVSKGIEFEASGSLGLPGLTFNGGFAYAKARLSKDFALPAGSATGFVVPDAIYGSKGDRLPGAPDYSGSLTVNYERPVAKGAMTFSLGADYRSNTVSDLPQTARTQLLYVSPAYVLFRGSVSYRVNDWELTAYADNLTDQHVVMTGITRTPDSVQLLGGWGDYYFVNKPREIGLKLTRRW